MIEQLAQNYTKSCAQILLRFGLQRQTAVICKSTQVARLEENFKIFDFELSQDHMDQISSLNRNQRYNDPGVFCEKAFNCFYPIYD